MRGGTKCPQQSPTHPQAHPEASANPLLRTAETLPSAGTWEGPQRQRGLLGSAESPPGHTAETRGGWNVEAGQAAGRQPCIPLRWRLCGGQARPKQGQPRDREMALGEWGETQGLGPRSLRSHSTQRMLHTHGVGHTHVGVLCRVTVTGPGTPSRCSYRMPWHGPAGAMHTSTSGRGLGPISHTRCC